MTPESYQNESKRVHFLCGSYGYNDKENFDLLYLSELCCEREENNMLRRKVAELQTMREHDLIHLVETKAKLDDLQASTIHSCGDSCSRPMF